MIIKAQLCLLLLEKLLTKQDESEDALTRKDATNEGIHFLSIHYLWTVMNSLYKKRLGRKFCANTKKGEKGWKS